MKNHFDIKPAPKINKNQFSKYLNSSYASFIVKFLSTLKDQIKMVEKQISIRIDWNKNG